MIDIAADPEDKKNYKKEEDPTLVRSEKGDRGPLTQGWQKKKPLMCCYKLVTAEFKMFGFQSKVENFLMKVGPQPLSSLSPPSPPLFSSTLPSSN